MLQKFSAYLLLLSLLYSVAGAQMPSVHILKEQYIFDTAPFESCHASTIVALNKDLLMSAWFGGKQEGSPDVCIWGALLQNGSWSAPVLLADGVQENGTRQPCWNPVLFKAENGILYLHYKSGPSPREWWAMYKTSNDNGKTWSAARHLPEGYLGPVKNKPVQLANGTILYPSSTESKDGKWEVHMEISDADLTEWKMVSVESDSFGVIQPTLLTYQNGRIQMLCRSRQNVIAQSWSDDGGKTWLPMSATSVPNPNSGIDAVTLQNGLQLLVYNPLPSGNSWWEGRSVLRVAVSNDGNHWNDVYTLEEHVAGEYSYPAVIQDKAGHIHITYTDRRKKIHYVEMELE